MIIRSIVAMMLCGIGVAGCQPVQNIQSEDAALARRVLAAHCVVGEWRSGEWNRIQVEYIRLGKVSKRNDGMSFSRIRQMKAPDIFVLSIQDRPEGWRAADAAYAGRRDNLYFNRQTGEFACSTDEWRAVKSALNIRAFEISPLIVSPTPKTAR